MLQANWEASQLSDKQSRGRPDLRVMDGDRDALLATAHAHLYDFVMSGDEDDLQKLKDADRRLTPKGKLHLVMQLPEGSID